MINTLELPTVATIGKSEYAINADFRDIFDIVCRMADPNADDVTLYVCMALFYDDFETMPKEFYGDAAEWMVEFINCGEKDDKPQPKTIDWEQDMSMIIADINSMIREDVRNKPFLHWWTFISFFNGIGEGQLSTIVSIREKIRKGKKLDQWEREFYRKNREKVDFQKKYSTADDEFFDAWLKKAR